MRESVANGEQETIMSGIEDIDTGCTCGGTTLPDTHKIWCPASLYQAGIQRGRIEAFVEAAKLCDAAGAAKCAQELRQKR